MSVSVNAVKRLVTLKRQIAAYASMVKRGDLTQEEGAVAIQPLEAEIASIRAQQSLLLVKGGKGA